MPNMLDTPAVQDMAPRRFVGPVRRYDMRTRSEIPEQWDAYNQAGLRVAPGGPDYFGVAFNSADDGSFDYLCGQEVSAQAVLPAGFGSVTLSGRYARFATPGHISTMQAVWAEVYGDWLKRPEHRPRPGPSVEYYPPAFNGMTGDGGFEIWVAVAG